MKAIVLNAFGAVTNFSMAELPLPVPGAADVLKVKESMSALLF